MNIDWITMLGNFSRVLGPIQDLVQILAFLIGLLFCFYAVQKFYRIADYRPNSSSQEKAFVAIFYFLGGSALIYLSSALGMASATLFGAVPNNILQYTRYNPYDIYNSMGALIQTAGLIWAVRGLILMVHASEPGSQEGVKGVVFFIGGIIAMNFQETIDSMNWLLSKLIAWTLHVKSSQGY